MKIEYLFTESRDPKSWGSSLIKWGTGKLHPELKRCSHIAVKIGPLVIESTLNSGVNVLPYQHWIKKHKVVYAFRCGKDRTIVDVLNNVFAKSWGKKYDYLGISFYAWRLLGFIILGRDLPQINRWQSDKRYFCVEMIESITGIKYQMTSPIQLVYKWKKQGMEEIDVNNYQL